MDANAGIAIRTENLAKTYRSGQSEVTVFRHLELLVGDGESVAVIGESGAGKSTLLHLLGGLDRPTEGTVYFGSKGISHLSDAELSEFRNREIGFVWQSHSLLPEFTALENVMMPLLIRGMSRKKAAPLAEKKLQEVGLDQRTTHRAGELSGGEQQRVAVARALVTSPSVLLADEPTGNLDYRTGEGVVSLLENLHRAHRLTSVIVTHNLAFARRCDRVLLLERGRLEPFHESMHAAETQAVPQTGTNGSTYV
ncbi:MAG: ABC transporter ATP-binding protein [Acidobacteria bacterium]|nr:ABC transporter ATP-binding protein [Acidobacteriota bacterium]